MENSNLLDGERRIRISDEIEIAYQTFGDPSDPPMLLVMGLGTQMIGWPEDLCRDLAGGGYYVIRYDNRDVGCSTHLDDLPDPSISDMRGLVTRRRRPPYSVEDMAGDALGLLDGLDLGTTHLVGVSLGGFIAQTAALRTPSRFRSLTLMMTSTGSRRVGQPRPGVLWRLARRAAAHTRAEAVDATIATYGEIGSPGFPVDEPYLRRKAELSWDRSPDTTGYGRQLAAVIAQPNRTDQLRILDLPTLVMHGLADPLVRTSGGLSLAQTIPGAKFVGYAGMGHDLPRALWPDVATEIGTLAARIDQREPVPATA